MRAQVKLSVLLVLAGLVQCGLTRGECLQRVWFDARAWYYNARGDDEAIDRLAVEGQDDLVRRMREAGVEAPDRHDVPCGAGCGDGSDRGDPPPSVALDDDSSDI